MLEEARKNAPRHREKYRQHLEKLQTERNDLQIKKQREKEKSERKLVEMKERITSELTEYGLWISTAEVKRQVSAITSETKRRRALKAQLRFRKKVLGQEHHNESVFAFSSKEKGQFTSALLCQNLLQLVQSCTCDEPTPSFSDDSLAEKSIQHNFKDSDGTVRAYEGRVISQVPGFEGWYNVVYTEEPGIVYTFKLTDDLKNGDLKVL